MNTNIKTLDHIEKWEISISQPKENTNEFWCLDYLWQGMELLAYQVQKIELIVQEKIDPNLISCDLFGNTPQLEGIPQGLLTSFFSWYAVSACKYVKLTCKIAKNHGLLSEEERTKSKKETADDQTKRIIPELVTYRDKIASKFCYTSHNKQDNEAEKIVSIMPQLTFCDDVFSVAAWQLATHGSNSAKLTKWSVTETHKILKKRYIGISQ